MPSFVKVLIRLRASNGGSRAPGNGEAPRFPSVLFQFRSRCPVYLRVAPDFPGHFQVPALSSAQFEPMADACPLLRSAGLSSQFCWSWSLGNQVWSDSLVSVPSWQLVPVSESVVCGSFQSFGQMGFAGFASPNAPHQQPMASSFPTWLSGSATSRECCFDR